MRATADILDYTPPPPEQVRRTMRIARWWFKPEFLGLQALDLEKPALFVGNHTLYGLTDVPLMLEHLYTQHGLMLRSLGDRGHFGVPLWGDWLVRHGMVLGSPANCAALMRAGASVLVFPGGAREVMRRRGEAYELLWKQRTGFARMAIEHGYDIIPFGAVGADESFDIHLDANTVLQPGWRLNLAKRMGLLDVTRGGDFIPPFATGIGPTLIPKPQRYYFGFGARIATTHLAGSQDDKAVQLSVRDTVAQCVREQIAMLQQHRAQDRPQWSRLRRALAPIPPPWIRP